MVGSIHRVLSCSSTSLSSGGAAAGVTCKNAFARPFTSLPFPASLFPLLLLPTAGAVIAIIKRIWKREVENWRLERVVRQNAVFVLVEMLHYQPTLCTVWKKGLHTDMQEKVKARLRELAPPRGQREPEGGIHAT